jgi:hypothetical protein
MQRMRQINKIIGKASLPHPTSAKIRKENFSILALPWRPFRLRG